MLKTLERYQKCSNGSLEVNNPGKDIEQSSYREYLKLESKYESLQRYQRKLLGDDLGHLNINDLEHIEHLLEKSLKHITVEISTMTAPDGRPWTFVRKVTNQILDHCSDPKPKKKESDDVCSDANDTLEILEKLYVMLDQLSDLQAKEKKMTCT
ncbi:developmental protein sepallata 2 [Phtheirospermum japonicum]|uniref:Developmental protein sepallata 2 n=1 Tax=Phtheirospermum japonicum TaxID=374723 RepID=A0A830BQM6_9LAMI|nr:developmental protein sepallata 2 [Phtheirospermum japonicum]